MAVFALVHGAWHGGWAWDPVAGVLTGRGHAVVAPDLPCEDPNAGAVRCAEVVRDALAGEDAAIVVGHSLGGLTIPLIGAVLHVYVCAIVARPGRSLADRGAEPFGPGLAGSVRDDADRSYWPDPAIAAQGLQYPAAHAALATRLRPQARLPSVEPSPLAALPSTPRAYVVCTRDQVVLPGYQRKMAEDELGVRPIELDSGHSPMLECPGALAQVLESLATGRAPAGLR